MPSFKQQVEKQLQNTDDLVIRSVYHVFANLKMPDGYTIRPTGHGYITNELRFEVNNRWHFSAVLNQRWVLWYFRLPAIKDIPLDVEHIASVFQQSETTKAGEVKLRVNDLKTAYAIFGYIRDCTV